MARTPRGDSDGSAGDEVKRLPFLAEHVGAVKSGQKRFTSRWAPPFSFLTGLKAHKQFEVGDIVACVTSQVIDGKRRPAFLVPASMAFCHVKIVGKVTKKWEDFTDEDAAKCGVTRDWYLKHSPPPIPDLHGITTYEFEVSPEAQDDLVRRLG